MVTITVVEPNALLRLGILGLLKTLDCQTTSSGIDYAQLFQGKKPSDCDTDLMLLSVPAIYDHAKELITTAQRRFDPGRILLLSDIQEPAYSLLNLPPVLAGYVWKFASPDILRTSIMLVLAGGKCFPCPGTAHAAPSGNPPDCEGNPRRRWYEHDGAAPRFPTDGYAAAPLLYAAPKTREAAAFPPTSPPAQARNQAAAPQALTPELIQHESKLLRLTPRQYGVLALMAKGYPLKKISRELAISMATVKTHTEALYLRLGANNRNAAVYAAVSRGATLGYWKGPQDPADPPSPSDSPADTAD